MLVSIFNDVIGPVMRGPSSSHCAAALRIGRLARDLMEARLDEVLVEFDRQGSLPTTHETQAPTWDCSVGCRAGMPPMNDCRFPSGVARHRRAHSHRDG